MNLCNYGGKGRVNLPLELKIELNITLASLQAITGVCAAASQISVATTDGIATKGHIL